MTTPLAPLVSVILPTHNRVKVLPRAIASVLCQTYRNLELIVVDDASTDGTADAVRACADPRLRYVRQERNLRAAAARNRGIREARGALIAFQDDDDVWMIHKLERQVAHLLAAPPDVGLSICGHVRQFPDTSQYVGGDALFAALRFDRGFVGDFSLAATPGWLVRREVLEAVGGFDEGMRCWDDWELACRMAQACRFVHQNEPLFVQERSRTAGGGMWDAQPNFANDYRIIVEKHGSQSPRARDRSRHYYLVGRGELADASARDARTWLVRALREHPLNLRAGAALALSYLGQRRATALMDLAGRARSAVVSRLRRFRAA